MITLDTYCSFCWDFGQRFLLEVVDMENANLDECGTGEYYVWSDPDYNGDNTIRKFTGDVANFTDKGFRGRDKGIHQVGRYCGSDVKFVERE